MKVESIWKNKGNNQQLPEINIITIYPEITVFTLQCNSIIVELDNQSVIFFFQTNW